MAPKQALKIGLVALFFVAAAWRIAPARSIVFPGTTA